MRKTLVQLNSLALGGSQIYAVDLAAATAAYGYQSVLVGPYARRLTSRRLGDRSMLELCGPQRVER
jgi:hypothetical protein